ncbi:MAG TPA: hypothetical protein DCQ30_06985 [Acidimicrobiaceae bacterium]|nr:hypothetical protein [Acidimicrobiaceae bacterium]
MHYVVLGVHSPEVCPTSNARTRTLLLDIAPQIPKIAEQNSVNILAGPFVNREHTTVVIVETERSENLDDFLNQTRLSQWNRVHIIPSLHLQEGIRDVEAGNSLF